MRFGSAFDVHRPTLLSFINGMPDFESMYPVLSVIQARGKIKVCAVAYWKIAHREPRLLQAMQVSGLRAEFATKMRMKFHSKTIIQSCDAVLSVTDPLRDTTTRRSRSRYIVKISKPLIFLQHGAYQHGVNEGHCDCPFDYQADKILLWEPPCHEYLAAQAISRTSICGFAKPNLFPVLPETEMVKLWRKQHDRVVLICQSFKWGAKRYSRANVKAFYELVDQLLSRNPNLGVILRSHRGRVRRNHLSLDRQLSRKHANVMFSCHRSGQLRGWTIHDVLSLSDSMVGPVSTTILDAHYSGKPVAVFDEGIDFFPELPQINSLETLEEFITQAGGAPPEDHPITRRFGKLHENLEVAATHIEEFMLREGDA